MEILCGNPRLQTRSRTNLVLLSLTLQVVINEASAFKRDPGPTDGSDRRLYAFASLGATLFPALGIAFCMFLCLLKETLSCMQILLIRHVCSLGGGGFSLRPIFKFSSWFLVILFSERDI